MNTYKGMTADQIIDKYGLKAVCGWFGWQGGTRWQAINEIKKRLKKYGIVQNKEGIFVELVIDEK